MSITNISKRNLWRYVNIKINKTIHYHHVSSIIGILFEEIIKDLKNDKVIIVHNFCELNLQKTKPRPYHDINLKKSILSSGSKMLKMKLAPIIKKKICALLDVDKTFKDD